MYATMLGVLAKLGGLEQHGFWFKKFAIAPNVRTARCLLEQIAVAYTDLVKQVRTDEDFKEHCAKRTLDYKKRAMRGDKKYKEILRNRKICDARGRWIGDIEEGIGILRVGRKPGQVRRCKNVQILNRARLMFDSRFVGNDQFCFLYPQKFHALFSKAVGMAAMESE